MEARRQGQFRAASSRESFVLVDLNVERQETTTDPGTGAAERSAGAGCALVVRGATGLDAGVDTTRFISVPADTTTRSVATPDFVWTLISCRPVGRLAMVRGAVPRDEPSTQTRAPAGPPIVKRPVLGGAGRSAMRGAGGSTTCSVTLDAAVAGVCAPAAPRARSLTRDAATAITAMMPIAPAHNATLRHRLASTRCGFVGPRDLRAPGSATVDVLSLAPANSHEGGDACGALLRGGHSNRRPASAALLLRPSINNR